MSMSRIIINTQFDAIHCWPDCTHKDVMFLRDPHRHIFHVTMKVPVVHDNRDVEFIRFKRSVEGHILLNYKGKDLGSMSCEMLCKDLHNVYPETTYVSVMEDGENGAEVEW